MSETPSATTSPVGTIFGDVTTTKFRITVEDASIGATAYIAFQHDNEMYLAQVLRIERESGPASSEAPTDRLVGEVRIIGRRSPRGRLVIPNNPPRPGSRVYAASPELVRSALNLHDTGAYLGMLRGLDVPVHLDVNGLVQKHCSILAKTGAGKSYALGVLMEELLGSGVPLVVIDPHGEHASLGAPNANDRELPLMRKFKVRPKSFGDAVVEYVLDSEAIPDGVPFKLDGRNLTAREVADLLGGALTSAQVGVVHQAIRDLKDTKGYTLEEIIAGVEQQSGNSKWPVLHALEDLQDLGLFSDEPTPVRHLVQQGQAAILNLKGAPPHVQELVVARVARDLFEARKVGLVDPHLFVLEEAHNYCPERNLAKAASGDVIRTIASEGRKFGMGLCVVSQRPAKVDKNVLSQCNSQIILKVTNANDLRAISSSVEGLPPGMEDEIQALPVGVALVSDPAIAVPLFCEIRPRQTRHGGTSIEVVRREDAPARTDPRAVPTVELHQHGDDTDLARPAAEHDGPVAAAPPSAPPTPQEITLHEAARAEALVADADLAPLGPGELESVLVEVEAILEALAHLADDPAADPGALAGLEGRFEAHRRRLVAVLRKVGTTRRRS